MDFRTWFKACEANSGLNSGLNAPTVITAPPKVARQDLDAVSDEVRAAYAIKVALEKIQAGTDVDSIITLLFGLRNLFSTFPQVVKIIDDLRKDWIQFLQDADPILSGGEPDSRQESYNYLANATSAKESLKIVVPSLDAVEEVLRNSGFTYLQHSFNRFYKKFVDLLPFLYEWIYKYEKKGREQFAQSSQATRIIPRF